MPAITRFTLVQIVAGTGSETRAAVLPWSPSAYELPALTSGHVLLGVAMTAADNEQPLAVMRHGYMRTVPGSGWSVGDILYGQSDASIGTTRPAAPLPQVIVGTVFADEGSGNYTIEVNVRVLPSVAELSGVNRETLADKDVLIFKAASNYFETRQLDHNTDLAGLSTADAHPASAITNTPAGGIEATTVQAAVDELDQEKAGLVVFYALGGF